MCHLMAAARTSRSPTCTCKRPDRDAGKRAPPCAACRRTARTAELLYSVSLCTCGGRHARARLARLVVARARHVSMRAAGSAPLYNARAWRRTLCVPACSKVQRSAPQRDGRVCVRSNSGRCLPAF
eukprot:IDg19379t1